MGLPLQKALPWKLRLIAVATQIYLKLKPQYGGDEEDVVEMGAGKGAVARPQ
jgi:hypothetical protein